MCEDREKIVHRYLCLWVQGGPDDCPTAFQTWIFWTCEHRSQPGREITRLLHPSLPQPGHAALPLVDSWIISHGNTAHVWVCLSLWQVGVLSLLDVVLPQRSHRDRLGGVYPASGYIWLISCTWEASFFLYLSVIPSRDTCQSPVCCKDRNTPWKCWLATESNSPRPQNFLVLGIGSKAKLISRE